MATNSNNKRTPDAEYLKWAVKQQTASTSANTLRIASAQLPLRFDELDTDPMLLNVQNGTIDLKTGELQPHQGEDFLTKICPVTYDLDADCPLFLTFLRRIFNEDDDLIRFLQKAVGYTCTASVAEQVFFLLYGTGANGKSTLMELLSFGLGDYAITAPPGLLMAKKNEAHPTDKANLLGARMVVSAEVKTDARWDEERIESLTGGDKIKARRMREDFWEFNPTHKLWIMANHRPATNDNSVGFWRRVLMIPFNVTIPEGERDQKLLEKLKAELPGILAWAVRGCILWQEEGLGMPASVKEATDSYRHETDDVHTFLDERCERGLRFEVQSMILYTAYRDWAIARGEHPVNNVAFSGRLRAFGIQTKKASSKYYLGLKLR